MQDAKLFRSLDRTIFLPVTASVFAIVLFSFMLMAERPGFGRSNLPAVHNPLWMPAASDEDAQVLTLLQDGRVFWGRDPTLVGELKPKLIHLLQRRPYSPSLPSRRFEHYLQKPLQCISSCALSARNEDRISR